jgi:hypothetical protein
VGLQFGHFALVSLGPEAQRRQAGSSRGENEKNRHGSPHWPGDLS